LHDWSSRDEIQLLLKLGTKLRIILRILSELTIFATSFRRYDETEETKNQVFGNIPALLVCLSGLSDRWSSEIPDIG
jgi:hypothetical protein